MFDFRNKLSWQFDWLQATEHLIPWTPCTACFVVHSHKDLEFVWSYSSIVFGMVEWRNMTWTYTVRARPSSHRLRLFRPRPSTSISIFLCSLFVGVEQRTISSQRLPRDRLDQALQQRVLELGYNYLFTVLATTMPGGGRLPQIRNKLNQQPWIQPLDSLEMRACHDLHTYWARV